MSLPLARALIVLVATKRMIDVYNAMLQRCENRRNRSWRLYGGRGIKVCERWRSIDCFFHDMAPSYSFGLTIERSNSDGNYEPSNCVWATRFTQNNNTSRNRKYTINGITRSISEWAHAAGVGHNAMKWRLTHWPHEHILEPSTINKHKSDGTFQRRCFTHTEDVVHVAGDQP